MTRELNLDEPITTRDGRSVRVICTDSKANSGPLSVLISERDGTERLRSYRRNGRRSRSSGTAWDTADDLINRRKKVRMWRTRSVDDLRPNGEKISYWRTPEDALRAVGFAICKAWTLYGDVIAIELVDMYEDELP